ncbi:MAG: phosphoribosylformylglycinamidine cyclo-ligase [Deltaproteobacteria bacterium]|nr:phosphoribosylformylglycinamidine cyclo-ligase [Deltaproteobacteria bacterium]
MKKPSTYEDAGVNIEAGNSFVDAIKPLIKKTHRPEVLSPLGGFAGMFRMNPLKYQEPVLVACTDGVGTKLKLANQLNDYSGIGIDLVAMCVNDLVCVGAQPLFFLDYYACGKLEVEKATQVVAGMTEALANIQCALLGGETAEMPGMYDPQDFDLAGFAVGAVERSEMIDGSSISIGNKIIGLASSGIHSNGYSLVRKIIEEQKLDLYQTYSDIGKNLGQALLQPTKIYVNLVSLLKKQFNLLGIAHITGGGILENIPRILPQTCQAKINTNTWKLPSLFQFLQEKGSIEMTEMHRVFNCGIGMVWVVPESQANEVVERLGGAGQEAYIIGEIVERRGTDKPAIEII